MKQILNKIILIFTGKRGVAEYNERLKINQNSSNYADLAAQMARDNGYPDEKAHLLQALLKSRNGNVDEAQEFLDDGKDKIAGMAVVSGCSLELNDSVFDVETLGCFDNLEHLLKFLNSIWIR